MKVPLPKTVEEIYKLHGPPVREIQIKDTLWIFYKDCHYRCERKKSKAKK